MEIEHKSLFFVYTSEFVPPYLGMWEFNKKASEVCNNSVSISEKIGSDTFYKNVYECLGHDNSHEKNGKSTFELSYHGDPCLNHKFRILAKGEKFPEWHPDKYYEANQREILYRNENGQIPCLNCQKDEVSDYIFYCLGHICN